MPNTQDWLETILEERGWSCLNCDHWRNLRNQREIEKCENCGDEAFEVFEAADRMELLP
jgi:Zn finger protein HypA/HybF involved in hydrogenase expression